MRPLKQGEGKVVVGDGFWDRETELAEFIGRINSGAHQSLVAQRRMGKTSLMKETKRLLEDSHTCLFVDLQDCKDAADAIAELSGATQPFKSIVRKFAGCFGNIMDGVLDRIDSVGVSDIRIKVRSGLTSGNWPDKGDQLFEILSEAAASQPVVVMLDELSLLINRMLKRGGSSVIPEGRAEADEFMSWLRKNSIRHQGNVRLVIAGSIGLEPVLRQAGLSATINNFVPLELKPWDEQCAKDCLEALALEYEVKFAEGATNTMVDKLGCCIPHHVQMYFGHVYGYCKRRGVMECTSEDAETVYQSEMLGSRGHAELTHYEERLKQVVGDELLAMALEMVTVAAVSDCLTVEGLKVLQKEYGSEMEDVVEAQKEILWVLEHDGYLQHNNDEYVFVSRLLKDWWKNRHGAFFTPLSERGV